MEIDKIYQDVQVNMLTVKREEHQYSVDFEFSSVQGSFDVNLVGVRDTNNLFDLLHAERLWVKEEIGTQNEYGRFTLGMQEESYSELVFDALS